MAHKYLNILITLSFLALLPASIFTHATRASVVSPTSGTMAYSQIFDEQWDQGDTGLAKKSKNRTEFLAGALTVVSAWPSTGGFYTLSCDGVELEFLGLSRFDPTPRSQDPAEEDAFCSKLRQLGPRYFSSVDEYLEQTLREQDDKTYMVTAYGWPATGGVWALKLNDIEAWAKGVGRIRNAFTMEERCREIEKLGGVFYANPKDCPDLDLP